LIGGSKISNFFALFRKKGTEITLNLLSKISGFQMLQTEFLKELKKRKNDLNAYFRVKHELLKYKIISIQLNNNAQKVITLTEKGKFILSNISSIEQELKE
jgi:predicted transcriptional regulator